jgi:Flp pilus assembly protein TadD
MKRIFILATLLIPLTGCFSRGDQTGAIARPSQASNYDRNPNDRQAIIDYGRALRQNGQSEQAVAVLQKGAIRHGNDPELLGEFGRALADNQDYDQALDVLSRAHQPERPDWRILNVQGTILDRQGKMQQARQIYKEALKINPGEPQILANVGLSFAMSGQPLEAEKLLVEAKSRTQDPAMLQTIETNLQHVHNMKSKMR